MAEQYKPKGKFAIAVGIILLLTTFSLLFVPTLILRWYANSYENQRQSYYHELAQSLEGNLENDNSPQVHLYYQNLMHKAGRGEELVDYYQSLVERFPNQPNFVYYLARLTENDDELLKDVTPYVPAAVFYFAETEYNHGFYMQSFNRLEKMPDSWIKHHRMALAADKMDEDQIALKHFKIAMDQKSVPPIVEVDFAEFLYLNRMIEDEAVLDGWSNQTLLNYPRAYALKRVRQEKDILDIFNESPLEIICTPESLNIMAEEALRQDDLITARILLNRSDQITTSATTKALFGILAHKEEREDTLELMGIGFNSDRYSRDFHVTLGHVLNRWDLAFDVSYQHFMKAWDHPPEHPQYLIYHANQILDDEPCKAAEFLNHSLLFYKDEEEKIIDIKQQLADAQEACGDNDAALKTYYELMQAQPEDYKIRMEIAKRLIARDQLNAAINLFYTRLKDEPNNGNLYASIGKIHLIAGNYDKAKSYLQAMIEQYPNMENTEAVQEVLAEIDQKVN